LIPIIALHQVRPSELWVKAHTSVHPLPHTYNSGPAIVLVLMTIRPPTNTAINSGTFVDVHTLQAVTMVDSQRPKLVLPTARSPQATYGIIFACASLISSPQALGLSWSTRAGQAIPVHPRCQYRGVASDTGGFSSARRH
jgi:hypothetical protein